MKKLFKIGVGLLAMIGILAIIAGILLFYFITKVDYKWTGEELFSAINEYRQSKNLSLLEQDPILCDNLVERYLAIKEPSNGHKGFEEWVKSEGISNNPRFDIIGELYVKDISTPNNAIAF